MFCLLELSFQFSGFSMVSDASSVWGLLGWVPELSCPLEAHSAGRLHDVECTSVYTGNQNEDLASFCWAVPS